MGQSWCCTSDSSAHFAADVLGWVPCLCASSFFVMLRITGQKGAALVRGSWWGLRENDCALVGIGDCEIPGYVLYSWFALKWLRKLLSATHSSKVSEEHLAGWSYCTETLLFPHLLSLIWPFWYRFVCKPLREAFSLFLPAACKALKWAFFPDVSPGAAPSAGGCVIFTFSQPGTGALHSTTVLFYCAGEVLSEGIAAHTTLGPGKDFKVMETMILSLSCSLWLSSRIYTDQQKIISRAQINYRSRKGSMSQKWGSYSLPCQKWALKIKVLSDQKLRYKVSQWHLLLVCEHEVGWWEERNLCLFKRELWKKSLKAVTGTQHGAD